MKELRYQSSKEAIQKNKYMEELQKTGDNLTADAISLKHLYYATKHKRPEDLTQVILKECDNEVTPAHTPPKTIEKKAIKKGF